MIINKLICYLKGHNQVYWDSMHWYDFTTTPWTPLECKMGKCARCGDVRQLNDNQ